MVIEAAKNSMYLIMIMPINCDQQNRKKLPQLLRNPKLSLQIMDVIMPATKIHNPTLGRKSTEQHTLSI